MTTPLPAIACAKSISPSSLSCSENKIGSMIIPAPASLSCHIISAMTVLFQGHCPYFSIDFSSISSIAMSEDICGVSYCWIKSNDFRRRVSLTKGSLQPIYDITMRVIRAVAQCVIHFIYQSSPRTFSISCFRFNIKVMSNNGCQKEI